MIALVYTKFRTFVAMMTERQQEELKKMMSGELYDATSNTTLLDLLTKTQELCYDYNQLRPSQVAERTALMRRILGKTGERFKIISPFFCDYGFNIEIGEDFFANTNLVILDEARVTFGDHVFIAPNCAFYTAGHGWASPRCGSAQCRFGVLPAYPCGQQCVDRW